MLIAKKFEEEVKSESNKGKTTYQNKKKHIKRVNLKKNYCEEFLPKGGCATEIIP